jgi:hypothetical protein
MVCDLRSHAGANNIPSCLASLGVAELAWTRLADHAERAHICAMGDVKLTCKCGAIYEVIETKGPSRDPKPFRCVLCEKELMVWEGINVGQFRLVSRPEQDRE